MENQQYMVDFNRSYVKRISVGKTIKGISYYKEITRIDFTDDTFLQLHLGVGLTHIDSVTAQAYARLHITGYDKCGSVIPVIDTD